MTSVLLLTIDCLRADHVGCYGYERDTTPAIDTLAERATVYRHAYSNSPGTRWAFQALHMGVHGGRVAGLGIPDDYTRTLARELHNGGLRTSGWNKNGFVSREWNYGTGFDEFVDITDLSSKDDLPRRLGRYIDEKVDSYYFRDKVLRPLKNTVERFKNQVSESYTPPIPDQIITDKAISWIEERQRAGQQYFGWLHFMNAHTPYGQWPEHLDALGVPPDRPHTINPGDEGVVAEGDRPPQHVIDAYDAGIRSVDAQIKRLLEMVAEDTVVIITADHGEEFGRYAGFHEESLHSSFTQVPLVVRSESLPSDVIEAPVQLLDVPPTVAREAGVPAPDTWDGRAIHYLEDAVDRSIFFDLGRDRRAVRRGDWKLIYTDGAYELYETAPGDDDTVEVGDEHPEVFEDLRERLRTHREQLELDEYEGHPDIHESSPGGDEEANQPEDLSEPVEDNLRELGYLE